MPIKFEDKDGKLLHIGQGDVDPDKIARIWKFKEGWTFSEIDEEEARLLSPRSTLHHDPRSSVERSIDRLIEILEDELQKPRGYLKEKLKKAQQSEIP